MHRTKHYTKTEVRTALGLTAALLLTVVLANSFINDPRSFDFFAVYAGGVIVRRGEASKLYDLKEQGQVQREFGRNELLVCAHPPFEIALFAPITKLNYRMAFILFGVINVLLWLLFQHILRPVSPFANQPYRYLMLCSLFLPLWATLMQGQMSLLLMIMFALTFVCLERHQDFRAGIFLGLGLFKFPIVLPFALICFFCKKWKLLLGFATAALLLAVVSLIVVGFGGAISYVKMLYEAANAPGELAYSTIKPCDMPTLTGFLMTLLTPHMRPRWITVAGAILSGALVVLTSWFWRHLERKKTINLSGPMFAAALTASLTAAPYLNLHDLTLMLLAVLLVLGSPQWASGLQWTRILTACIIILYFPPVYILLLRHSKLSLLCPVLLCFAIGSLYLAAGRVQYPALPTTIAD